MVLWEVVERIRCPRCGTPMMGAGVFKWHLNGMLTVRTSRNIGTVILNPEIFEEIIVKTEEVLNYPVRKLAYEAQRNVSKAVIEDTFKGIPGSEFLKSNPLGYRMAVRFFYILSSVAGYADTEKIKQVPHSYSVSVTKNPYQLDLMMANVVGAFEGLEGVPYESHWDRIDNDKYLVTAVASTGKPEVSQRLQIDNKKIADEKINMDKCAICGVPKVVSERLDWDLSEGIIRDRQTGIRISFMVSHTIKSMFRELASELGDDILEIIVECMRGWTSRNIEYFTGLVEPGGSKEDQLEAVLRRYLQDFPAYGKGFAVSTRFNHREIDIVIENPYEELLISGTLRGIYESIMKTPCNVTVKQKSESEASFSLRPA